MTSDQTPEPPSTRPDESRPRPSIPILLRLEETGHDLEAIRAWQEALSDALMEDVPHDLFALWLYPQGGGVVLIGPEALAQDHLAIPLPGPFLDPRQLAIVEEIVRDAGYRSTRCLGVRHGSGDVGLLLIADLRPDQYGPNQEVVLEAAIRAMGPILGRIARRWQTHETAESEDEPPPLRVEKVPYDAGSLASMFSGLGQASIGAGTPRDFTLAISYAMQPLLPHDYVDLLIPDHSGEQHYRLGGHGLGPLWSDPSLVLTAAELDVARVFGESGRLLVEDGSEDEWGSIPILVNVRGAEGEARSALGVRLRVLERTVGYLLIGSSGPGMYGESDLTMLEHVGALIAARVESLVLEWQQQVLRSHLGVLRHIPMHLSKIAEQLAALQLLGEGTRMFAQQAAALLPLNALEFALRLADENRVAIVTPGDATPLADLPQVPIAETTVAKVIRGTISYLLAEDASYESPASVLVVPLRVAGEIIGALAMTGSNSAPFTRTDMAVAQQLADLIAPHFEIQRRSTAVPPPFTPGWKRSRY